mmetsp:Transcript_110250/g.246399  ORF Transcript_110250/g.246399 Transcript_110250/m.246399 type:complete len:83 (-) Transcript_110250:92-340(-)
MHSCDNPAPSVYGEGLKVDAVRLPRRQQTELLTQAPAAEDISRRPKPSSPTFHKELAPRLPFRKQTVRDHSLLPLPLSHPPS